MGDHKLHKIVSLDPTPPRKVSIVPPPEFLRPYPTIPEKKKDAKSAEGKRPNTFVVITTPPELRTAPATPKVENAPNQGLQYHLINRGSLIDTGGNLDTTAPPAEDSFEERYVDVVDTEVANTEGGVTHSYESLTVHVRRIYMVLTLLMLLDASFSALAMYSVEHLDETYAHDALGTIFTNRKTIFFHVVILMFVIASFPLVVIAIIAYPKPKFIISHARWGFFIVFEFYLVLCLVMYGLQTNSFYSNMEAKMNKDLREPPDLHLTLTGAMEKQNYITLRDFTQSYYGCCGVYGIGDWTEALRDNLLDMKGYPIGCCKTSVSPKDCFPPVQKMSTVSAGEPGEPEPLLYTEGCLKLESRWTYIIASTYMIVVCCIIIITSVTTVYLYYVIKIANKYDIDLTELVIT